MGRGKRQGRGASAPNAGEQEFLTTDKAPLISACPECGATIHATAIVTYYDIEVRDMGDHLTVDSDKPGGEDNFDFFCANGHNVFLAVAASREEKA